MRRYNIRIDGEVMPKSYTYEELRQNGVLDFDDIEVKLVSGSSWSTIKSYCFPEENGRKATYRPQPADNSQQNGFYINEFGEIVNNTNIGGGATQPSESMDADYDSSQPSQSSSADFNNFSTNSYLSGWNLFIKLFLTIAIVGILIGFFVTGRPAYSLVLLLPALFSIVMIWN